MASEIEKWMNSTRAALDAGKNPCLPTAREFGKMCPALRTAKVTLSFWWCDDKAESEITIPFFRWLRIVRGERFEHRQRPESFEGDTIHPAWVFFNGLRFGLVDYENGADYYSGDLEDLCVDSSTPGVDDLASLVLLLRRANTPDEGR